MEFTQLYHKAEKSNAKFNLHGVAKEIHYLKYSDEMSKVKQKNAIIPNVIHSLDASHAYSIILESSKNMGKNVISIHDCFGSHPNDMAEIHHIVRKTFILQYTENDFLKEFRERIINLIKLDDHEIIEEDNKTTLIYNNKKYIIPNTPELGKFELQKIRESRYIIC